MKKRILIMIIAIVMVVGLVPGFAVAASAAEPPVATGYCNETGVETSNLTAIWELSTDGTLTIKKSSSGGTLMSSFSTLVRPSWETYKDQIKKVVIEDDITSLGSYAFYQYTALEEVVIGNGIMTIPNLGFYGCTELTKVTIGSSVRKIISSAFNGCTSLANVTLPNGVTTIGSRAFAYCPMTEITIPASVTAIEGLAFEKTNLTKVTYLGTTDPGADSISVFPYINNAYPTIYVPADYIGTTFCKYTVTKAESTTDTNAIVVSATPAEGGSVVVTVNGAPADKAKKDTVVTITVTENAGYVLKSLVAADADDGNIELTKDDNDDNKYTFTMPEKAVSVTAVFKEDSSLVYVGGTLLTVGTYYKCANNTLTSDGTADDYNAYLTFNEATGYTLNIKNLTVSGVQNTNYGAGIYSANDDIALTINFAGTNIINGAENETNAAIYSLGDLNITGSGTLTANGSATTSSNHIQKSFGIAVDDGKSISITNANVVYANAGYVNYSPSLSRGLRASNILIENSIVYANGGQSVGQSGYSEGIEVVSGTLRIKGAGTRVEAISGDEGYNKNGISGYGGSNTLYLESGLLRVESKNATENSSGISGITLNMTGGVFESVCGTAKYAFPIANPPTIAEGLSIYDSDNNIINYTNDYTIFKNYSFVRIAPSHIHDWQYSASGDTITATCSNTDNCPETEQSITISATGKAYDGTPVTATLTGSIDGVTTPTINYSGNTNVGTYTASITIEGVTAEAEFSIEKATPTVTAPTAVSNLEYTGEAQVLVTAGTTSGGTLQYKVDNGEWSEYLPTATNAGTYTVYYKVIGNDNYNDVAETSFTVTIEKATLTASDFTYTAPADLVYNGTKKEASVTTSLVGVGTVTVKYYKDGGEVASATNVGTYTVKLDVAEGDNYNAATGLEMGSFEIAKATPTLTVTSPVTSVLPGNTILLSVTANDSEVSEFTISAGDLYTVNGMKITVSDNAVIGQEITVTVTSAATDNYNAATATITLDVGMADFSGEIAELEAAIEDLQNQINANDGDITKINETLTEIDGLIKALQAADKALGETDADLQNQITEAIAKADSELKAAVETINATIDEKVKDLQEQISSNDGEINTINETLTEIDGLIKALQAADKALGETDADLQNQITEAIAKADSELKAAVETINATIDEKVKDLQEQISSNDGEITKINETLTEIDGLIKALQAADKALGETDADLQKQITEAIAKADSELKAAKAALEKSIGDVQTNLDNAKNELDQSIKDGDAALDGKITALDQALKDAKAALEKADRDNKAALEQQIASAQSTLQAAINKVAGDLSAAEAALTAAINAGDAALEASIGRLNDALVNAIAAYQAADSTLKSELTEKIDQADASFDAAIKAVQKNLDDAKAALEKALADGDKANADALAQAISDLNAAIDAAETATATADGTLKSELTTKIDNADATLQAAIDALSTELDATNEKVDQLETFIIIVCVISGVAFCGCGTLAVFYFIDKKKKI